MKKSIVIGSIAGVILGITGVGLAQWAVTSNGTAGGGIGSVDGVTVTAVYGGNYLPGDDMPLRADIVNPNEGLSLKVVKLGVTAFETDKEGCELKGRFDAADNLVLPPGKTENVTVGVMHLSANLDDACAGAKVTAKLAVRTTWVSS
jgi:hypothetical protein